VQTRHAPHLCGRSKIREFLPSDFSLVPWVLRVNVTGALAEHSLVNDGWNHVVRDPTSQVCIGSFTRHVGRKNHNELEFFAHVDHLTKRAKCAEESGKEKSPAPVLRSIRAGRPRRFINPEFPRRPSSSAIRIRAERNDLVVENSGCRSFAFLERPLTSPIAPPTPAVPPADGSPPGPAPPMVVAPLPPAPSPPLRAPAEWPPTEPLGAPPEWAEGNPRPPTRSSPPRRIPSRSVLSYVP
jgi:hypothetical protein